MDEKTTYKWAGECLKPLDGLVNSENHHKFEQAADKIASAILAANGAEAVEQQPKPETSKKNNPDIIIKVIFEIDELIQQIKSNQAVINKLLKNRGVS